MALHPKDRRFNKHDVLVHNDRPLLITQLGEDSGLGDTIHYSYVNADGTLSAQGGTWKGEWAVPPEVKHVDFAKVRTVVELPPEWKERALTYEQREADETKRALARSGEWEPESHPSYGLMTVSRTSGYTPLFGSPFKHQHYISLNIGRATRYRDLANDRFFGGLRGDLVTVALSEAQWANLLSSIGQGNGVPCTVQRVGGKMMEPCPEQAEAERFHADVERSVKEASAFLDEALKAAEALAEEKAPSKAKREAITALLTRAKARMTDSAPFVVQQFHERMEVVKLAAKTEIEAYAQRTLVDAGLSELAKLKKGASAIIDMPKALDSTTHLKKKS